MLCFSGIGPGIGAGIRAGTGAGIGGAVQLLKVSGQCNSGPDVFLLTGFVSTNKKDDEFAIPFGVVNPVPRPCIHLQLGDTLRQMAMLAGIAMGKPVCIL